MINRLLLLLFLTIFISCSSSKIEKEGNTVIITLPQESAEDTHLLKLRVFTPNLVRVAATPGLEFKKDTSLSVILSPDPTVNFTTRQHGDIFLLTTDSLRVEVSLKNGAIKFFDQQGNLLLEELTKGGKTFSPYELENESVYQIRQQFNSPVHEAFYGLGQHQNSQMNYKGEDVDLTQYNSVIAVPFLVSNQNYGILWDNYSMSKFGDPRDYQPLSDLKLYDRDGQPGGLTAHYQVIGQPDQQLIRVENGINYKYLEDMQDLPASFPLDNARVTFEGFIESDHDGLHKFLLTSAGYTKVWIDGDLKSQNWREAWNPNTNKFKADLKTGQKHALKIEWEPDGGESYLALEWLNPLDSSEQNQLSLSSKVGDQIDYYFIAGKSMDQVISGYRQLTGKAPIMPKWAMGLWQSRERYRSQNELLDVVNEYRQRQIPLDNIVLDWQYWVDDQWGSHEFDAARFPDPEGMIDQVHQKNAQIMISVWPKFYTGTRHYQEMDEQGWLYTGNVENQQKDWIGYVSTFYDAFNPGARQLFWQQISDQLFSKGIDAWWMDATEPDILSNSSLEHRIELMKPNALGHPASYFNAYPLMNASAVYEGQRAENPDQRVFILTRSGFAGIQRYAAACWSGDISARWDEFARQIPAGLNFSLSGIPYWTTDIGGFFVEDKYDQPDPQGQDLEEWRELMARWFQFGTFSPLLRIHGQYPYREIFNVAPADHPAYQSMVKFDRLRYRLMPYIYTQAADTYHNDKTIMRALVMDFPDDPKVLDLDDQYMFGPSLMVSPVTKFKASQKDIYLPAGCGWYNFFTGDFYQGGRNITVETPLDRMPLMVKAGSILTTGPEIQYATENSGGPLTIFVFTGQNGNATIYEDENVNYGYESGAFSRIPLRFDDQNQTLEIGERQGSFPGMATERTFRIVAIDEEENEGVRFDRTPDQIVTYRGDKITVKTN